MTGQNKHIWPKQRGPVKTFFGQGGHVRTDHTAADGLVW